jgi:hypothetical protein
MTRKKAETKNDKYTGVKLLIGAILLFAFMIVSFLIGVAAGANIVVPKDINITMDTGPRYDNLLEGLKNVSKIQNSSCHNLTFTCALNVSEQACQNVKCPVIVHAPTTDSFCKLPNKIGPTFLNESIKTVYLELNTPVEIGGYWYEIIGANADDWQGQSIILDRNGVRKTFHDGETYIDKDGVQVTLVESFVANIPTLYASGNFIITNAEGRSYTTDLSPYDECIKDGDSVIGLIAKTSELSDHDKAVMREKTKDYCAQFILPNYEEEMYWHDGNWSTYG